MTTRKPPSGTPGGDLLFAHSPGGIRLPRVRRVLVAFVMVFVALPVLVGAGGNSARSEHQRIVDFWTAERVAQAVPRDFVFNLSTGRFGPAHHNPGHGGGPGGGGPGGGDPSVITGVSYTAGGEVTGTTGKVLFALGGSYYVCSASVIDDTAANRSIILTAGHCVYDNEPGGEFATNWMFIPDYDAAPAPLDTQGNFCDATLYGCWTATALTVHNGFAQAGGFNDQAVLYDWGFAVVGEGGHDMTLLESEVGSQGYSFAPEAINATVTGWAFGYPAQKKFKGNDLIYCSNKIDGDPYNDNDTYRMNQCKLNGGSSGGPWFKAFSGGSGMLISVNSYGYGGVTAMHGPMFNSNTAATYNAALTANGNTPVGVAP